jgi:hypothetical protein
VLTIDCNDCTLADSDACGDCLVSFIVNREPGQAVVIDVQEERAVRMMGRAGLVAPLRHQHRVGAR